MNIQRTLLVLILWSVAQLTVHALDPSDVDGVVEVQVDRSKQVWVVTVTNHSKEDLRYEMLGKVPRGLALELWDVMEDPHMPKINAVRIHAENLAHMNEDFFPADLRTIAPGGSVKFPLDPKSMSTTDDLALAKWERAKRIKYYECRVVFGMYASRMMEVEPRPEAKGLAKEQARPDPIAEKLRDLKDDEPFGFQVRRMLDLEGLALVAYSYGTNGKGESELTLTTCEKKSLKGMEALDAKKPAEMPMHQLIATAQKLAREELPQCTFEGFMINPCDDDSSKFYASFYFANDQDDTVIDLLMNGAAAKTITFAVTEEQYRAIAEFRIPIIQEKVKAAAPKK